MASSPSKTSNKGHSALRVDPRIERRRQQVQRAQRRHRKNVFIGLGVTVAIVLIGFGVLWTPLFAVEHVNVVSQDGRVRDDLVSVAGIVVGDPMVNVDANAIEQRLLSEPDVLGAQISRDWPRTINMVVIEENPELVIHTATGRYVIGEHGGVLGEFNTVAQTVDPARIDLNALEVLIVEGVPEVTVGSPLTGATWVAARALQQFPDSLSAMIENVTLSTNGTLEILTHSGETVQFGSPEESTAKVVALQSVFESVDPECRSVIDVRDPIRITVTRSPSCLGYDPATTLSDGTTPSSSTPSTSTQSHDDDAPDHDSNAED